MNDPNRKEWLTTDQEMSMVHYVNERKLREMFSMLMTSQEHGLQ